MLRISESSLNGKEATLRLEGSVVGPWVEEVRKACEQLLGASRALTLDLADVSFADRDGIVLLHELNSRAVRLVNCSPFLNEQLKSAEENR